MILLPVIARSAATWQSLSLPYSPVVIPAQAGIQERKGVLDSGFRQNDIWERRGGGTGVKSRLGMKAIS